MWKHYCLCVFITGMFSLCNGEYLGCMLLNRARFFDALSLSAPGLPKVGHTHGHGLPAQHYHVPNIHESRPVMTVEMCMQFCQYETAVSKLFDYVALLGLRHCFCLLRDDIGDPLPEGECTVNEDVAVRVYRMCPAGFYGPPFCKSPCKLYCKAATNGPETGKRLCYSDGKCVLGCENNFCWALWGPCQTMLANKRKGGPVSSLKKGHLDHKAGILLFKDTLLEGLQTYQEGQFVLTEVTAWTRSKGEAIIGIWCPVDGQHYRLVGQFTIKCLYCHEDTETSFTLQPKEYIFAEQFCVYGIHQSAKFLSGVGQYDKLDRFTLLKSTDQVEDGAGVYSYVNQSLDNVTVGEVRSFPEMEKDLYGASVQLSFQCLCPRHCLGGICDRETGLCTEGCDPGYSGHDCGTICPETTFGFNCSQACPLSCANQLCHNEFGHCTHGCAEEGFYSPYCNTTCAHSGFFGRNCHSKCSPNCKHGVICDHHSGECPDGCEPGFQPPDCWKPCPDNSFGPSCQYECGDCLSNSCNKVTGMCELGCDNSSLVSFGCACAEGSWSRDGITCSSKCGNCAIANACHDILGTCLTGCQPGFTPPACSCEIGKFGENCSLECGNCSDIDKLGCDPESGHCVHGCQAGYTGSNCSADCPLGSWGQNCSEACGRCLGNLTCSSVTGECEEELCEEGYKPPSCRCPLGTYGVHCEQSCGQCEEGTYCHDSDGSCPSACENSTAPPYCLCPLGWYGENCSLECGHCAGDTCSPRDGSCDSCKPGYTGEHCTEICPRGTYGKHCKETCGNCLNGPMDCNVIDGSCFLGCQPFYVAPLCHDMCQPGTFGVHCSNNCGFCRNNAPCDIRDGSCAMGCEGTAVPPLCLMECPEGMYGPSCNTSCGKCVNGTKCDPINGSCPVCDEDGLQPPLCQDYCHSGTYGPQCTLRCGMCRSGTVCNAEDGRCPDGCSPAFEQPMCKSCKQGYCGLHCLGICGQCIGGKACNTQDCICPHGCWDGSNDGLCGAFIVEDIEASFQQQFVFKFDLASWGVSSCPPGIYGSNCTKKCGHCEETDDINNRGCEQKTGDCMTRSCEPGFEPPLCQVCSKGNFGFLCSQSCGFCVDAEACRGSDGACIHGCTDGYQLPDCKQKCSPGFYGKNCQFTCNMCLNPNDCDFVTGVCLTGCVLGWIGEKCDTYIGKEGLTVLKMQAADSSSNMLLTHIKCIFICFSLYTIAYAFVPVVY